MLLILFSISDFLQLIAVLSVFTAVIYGVLKFIQDRKQAKSRKHDYFLEYFGDIVSQLNSDNKTTQLSAAILLRRYLLDIDSMKHSGLDLRVEAVNVISGLLKVAPVGTFQKALGDGLAYASDLSHVDFQKANLQDIYLGRKDGLRIIMRETDLFKADLSYSNLDGIDGQKIIFKNTILFCTRIKNSDFSGANFVGADLSNAVFKGVNLYGADFTNAVNIPDEISNNLDDSHKCILEDAVTTLSRDVERKKIFFSMPGCMKKSDEILTMAYRDYLEKEGYEVIYYNRDDYPEFGQLSRVRESIKKSSAMIVFGFKQIGISNGVQYPDTDKECVLENVWMSTSWNELEFGMGLMQKLPILIVKDKDIESGMFDSKLSECFVSTVRVDSDIRELRYDTAYLNWLTRFV